MTTPRFVTLTVVVVAIVATAVATAVSTEGSNLAWFGRASGASALDGASEQTVMPAVEFKLIDGRRIHSTQLKGQVVLVDFWATSCAICIAEMPDLQRTYQVLKDEGLAVIAVAMPYDRPDHVLNFVETRQIELPVALDIDGTLLNALGPVPGTPTRVLVSRSGKIVARWIGPIAADDLHQALQQELARKQSGALTS
ncbi:MAG: TlpA disulfide reductase family protein [Burkholderiaceae bacterium]